jgi:hypothetical protein
MRSEEHARAGWGGRVRHPSVLDRAPHRDPVVISKACWGEEHRSCENETEKEERQSGQVEEGTSQLTL